MNAVPARRPYDSRLRREQQQETRERIVTAATDLLGEGNAPSMATVAERAGVSERTVYRHFATRTDLFGAVFASLTDLVAGVYEPTSLDELTETVRSTFPRYERRPEVIRALNSSEIAEESRAARAERRRAMVESALADITAGFEPAEKRRLEAAVHVLASSSAYLHLHDFWSMDAEESAGVVEWAVRALVRVAVEEGTPTNGSSDRQPRVGRTRRRRVGG